VRFSFLILIGRFGTLEGMKIKSATHAPFDDHGQFCCFGSRRISRWRSSRPCSANARPQTARRWATRRRPESREPLRPVAGRQKPQATAGRRRELRIEAARQSPLYLDLPTVIVDLGLPRLPRRERPPGPRGRRPGVGPVLAEVDDALIWSSTGPGTVPVQDGARRGRGVARGHSGSRVTVGVHAGRRCWGWCCR
jgi:hypothetical protein